MSQHMRTTIPVSTEVIDGVPEELVTQVTEDFRDSGAVEVKAELKTDGTWTVTAVLPG
jgi:hypothetical protein